MKAGEQKGGTFIGCFQRCFIKLVNFIENPFFFKAEKGKSTFSGLDREPIRVDLMGKSTLRLLCAKNSRLLSHSWDCIIKSEKIVIALYY